MAWDNEWVFSDDAEPSALTQGNRFSENYHGLALDSSNLTGVDLVGGTMPPRFYALFTTDAGAPTSGGSATINFQLISSTDTAGSSGVVVHYETGVLAFDEGTFDTGEEVFENLDPNQDWKQYIQVRVVIADADLTAFTFTSALVDSVQSARTAYATRFDFT